MEDTRTPVRKAISIVVGLLMLAGGVFGFIYMFLFSLPVKGWFWMAPVFVATVGGLILWDDMRSFFSRQQR